MYICMYIASCSNPPVLPFPGGAVAGRAAPLSVGHLLRVEHRGVAHLHAPRYGGGGWGDIYIYIYLYIMDI